MKIVAPRAVLAAARRAPAAALRALAELERRPPAPGEAVAEEIERGRVLGVEAGADHLALRFLADVSADAALGELPPLASVSRRALLALGVPEAAVLPVQQARSLAELGGLELPPAVAARVRFRALQLVLPPPRAPDRMATDRAHLGRYLHGEIAELMLHLDPTQERIVALDGAGSIVVRGVAGSGKTAVALHRIERLLRQRSLLGGPRLLFLTFNRALAVAARELVAGLGVARDPLEIATLHGYAGALVREGERIDGIARRRLITRAQAAVGGRGAALPVRLVEQEIALIKTRVDGGLDAYLALRRHGAARPLDARTRTEIWAICAAYDRLCAEAGVLDFDEVLRRAYAHLLALGEAAPRYDHVLCDEAQDFPVIGLRLAALLGRPPGHVFLAYDPAQSLYQRGFRWKDGGLVVHGARSIDLARNFRNTREILETARPLLVRGAAEDEDAALEPEPGTRAGPPVARVRAAAGAELAALVADLRARIERGLTTAGVALLAPRNRDLRALEAALAATDIPSLRHGPKSEIRLADPRVKLLTFHSAKGLEFPVVYVLATAAALEAAAGPDRDEERVRRLLYVAMTRAAHGLVLVTTRGAEPDYLRPP